MRILITGGAGCLGSNLIDRYLPNGHKITVIDNFATGKKGNLPDLPGLSAFEGDIADLGTLEEVFAHSKPEIVIHSAASYKNPSDWAEDARTNIIGSINLAKLAEQHGCAGIINFQTALCYGRPSILPIPTTYPLFPFTSYGVSKTAGEQYLLQGKVPVVSLRLANITGPRLAIGPIPTFYKRLKAGQKCFCSASVRDFLDIDDFFELIDRLLHQPITHGVFNVSTGKGYSIKQIFDAVSDYLGIMPSEEVPILPVGADDVEKVVLDPSATMEKFGWEAKVDFTSMINKMLKWYDVNGVTDVFSHLAKQSISGGATE
jgi:nucleoside-diphosphate-sugar epimerase